VGKTFAVCAVASSCGLPLTVVKGSELLDATAGRSERRLRDLFSAAQGLDTPTVLFIDEIDAMCGRRDGARSHEARLVAQLLTLMDGSTQSTRARSVLVIGATNRPNSLDPALRRPGRLEREVAIGAPVATERLVLLKSITQCLAIEQSLDLAAVASAAIGYTASDLAALCRMAAESAIFTSLQLVSSHAVIRAVDFTRSLERIVPSSRRGTTVGHGKTCWGQIGGLEHIKARIRQWVEWPLLHSQSFRQLNLHPPRGILLHGPPGCAKTTLVKAVATAASASFHSISGGELYSSFLGESERALRDLFDRARRSTPAIIFLDEIEAIVGRRGTDVAHGGEAVQARVLSTLLNELDGIEAVEGLLLLGATNRIDLIDAALLRPGRFDEHVFVPLPDAFARSEILQVHAKAMAVADDVSWAAAAEISAGLCGAELMGAVHEAAYRAIRTQLGSTEDVDPAKIVLTTKALTGAISEFVQQRSLSAEQPTGSDASGSDWEDVE
jgi:transitional endoplasmic reticulum ATPase